MEQEHAEAGASMELDHAKLTAVQTLEGTVPASADDALDTCLFNPCGVAASPTGDRIFIADTGHHRICVLEHGGLRVLAGSGMRGFADGVCE